MLERSGTLKMPDKSKLLFDKYRGECDIAKQFISEVLIPVEGAKLKFKSVYDEYKDWARDNGYGQCSRKTFKNKMEKHVEIKDYIGQACIFGYDFQSNMQIPFD